MQALKNNFGYAIYKFMLQCCLISLAFLIIMLFSGDVGLNFWDILELILSIPLFSVIIALIRLALKCVHTLLSYGGVLRFVIDIVVSLIVILAIGHFIPTTMSDIVATILLIVVDLLYIVALLYFKTSPRSEE